MCCAVDRRIRAKRKPLKSKAAFLGCRRKIRSIYRTRRDRRAQSAQLSGTQGSSRSLLWRRRCSEWSLRLRPPEETLSPTGRELKPQGDMSQDEPRGHGKQDVEGVPNAILAQLTGSSGSLPSSTPGVDEPALRATEPPCHRNNLSETAPKLSKPAHRWPSAFLRRAKVSHSCSRQHQWPSCFLKRLCLHCEPSTW